MRLSLRGPDGARQRMEELQAKVEGLRARQTGGPAPAGSFQGQIGAPAADADATSPLSPFAQGVKISSNASPELTGLIDKAARDAGLDPKLLDALVATESAYNPSARSHVGAMGLTQLMPSTAKELGIENPFDPAENLRGGAQYLARMLKQFQDPRLALAAYNAGPGSVQRAGNQVPNYAETKRYVEKVMALYEGASRA